MSLARFKARPALSLWSPGVPVEPPSSAVVAAVLAFGDLVEGREDGTTLIRFSPARIEREDIRLLLGDERDRALDISIVWDDREEQLLQVLDVAPLRAAKAVGNPYADARLTDYARVAEAA